MNTKIAHIGTIHSLAAILVFFALAQIGLCSQAVPDKKADTVLVPDGTQVHLVLMDDLQGKQLKIKQTVHFRVREDLVVGSRLVVKTGAVAIGHIESVSKSGLFGKSGKLVLQFDYVESASGIRSL